MQFTFNTIDSSHLHYDMKLSLNNQYYELVTHGTELFTWDTDALPAGLREYMEKNLIIKADDDILLLTRDVAKELLKLSFKDDFRLTEMCKAFQCVYEGYVSVVVYRKP